VKKIIFRDPGEQRPLCIGLVNRLTTHVRSIPDAVFLAKMELNQRVAGFLSIFVCTLFFGLEFVISYLNADKNAQMTQ